MGRNFVFWQIALLLIGRPLREGVGRNYIVDLVRDVGRGVALYARAWVEITAICKKRAVTEPGRPLREGVGRNLDVVKVVGKSRGRPLREGVGRNCRLLIPDIGQKLSPSTRGRG